MIGDKKKSHRNIVFFIHQNSDISECWIHVPQVNFVGEFGIHDFWRVLLGSQFSFGGKHSLYVFGFHFIHTLNWVGVKGGLFLEFHYTFMSESQIFSQFQTRFTCPPPAWSWRWPSSRSKDTSSPSSPSPPSPTEPSPRPRALRCPEQWTASCLVWFPNPLSSQMGTLSTSCQTRFPSLYSMNIFQGPQDKEKCSASEQLVAKQDSYLCIPWIYFNVHRTKKSVLKVPQYYNTFFFSPLE